MSTRQPKNVLRIEQLEAYLRAELYSEGIQRGYPTIARRFISYVASKSLSVEAVCEADIESFLQQEIRIYRKRHGCSPPNVHRWRQYCAKPVHLLLRLARGQWPPPPTPATALEVFHLDVVREYDNWMRDLRGLASVTRSERIADALRFLAALGERGGEGRLAALTIRDVDAYVQQRCAGLRRRSIKDVTSNLRVFLRYLHGIARTDSDLSRAVIGPKIHEYEDIPSALRAEEVEKVLDVTRKDHSAVGLRDNAMLMLLATYGLRAGEIVALRLQDLDWRRDVLHVRHSKTGISSELPLLRAPGEAILRYLEKGRRPTALREVFLRVYAPYRPFKNATSLYSVVQKRLALAGVVPSGKRGPHAFRHARAVSLLRATVPLKTIGDVLGHRSSRSTGVYLKFATEALRAVGLDVPGGVSP
jgi:integrase/recombinase XerD